MLTINPYGKPSTQTVAIKPAPITSADLLSKQQQKMSNKIAPAPIMPVSAPLVKPEHQQEFQRALSQQQTPEQFLQIQQRQKEAKDKAKKELYVQKYKEAKQMSRQNQNHEESFQSVESSDEEEYYDEEDDQQQQPPVVESTP